MKDKQEKKKLPIEAFHFSDGGPTEVELKQEEGSKPKAMLLGYSGKPMRHWYFGNLIIDLATMKFGKKRYPLLYAHDTERPVGHFAKPEIRDNQLIISEAALLSNDDAQDFIKNSKDGFPYEASIRVDFAKMLRLQEEESVQVNGIQFKGPGIVLKDTTFRECSICVFGVDSNTNSKALSEGVEIETNYVVLGEEDEEQSPKHTDIPEQEVDVNMKLTLAQLKEQNPELVTQLTEELQKGFTQQLEAKDKEIESQKVTITQLSETNKLSEDRLAKLEKTVALQQEQGMQARAASIVEVALSSIPEERDDIKQKLRSQFSYHKFVKDGALDEAAFSEHVKKEVDDWNKIFSKPSVIGSGSFSRTTTDNGASFSEEKVNSIADRMVGMVGGGKSE
jgi:hypothetical protein